MSDKGTRSEKAGSGLLPAGVILLLLFGAAGLLALQRSAQIENPSSPASVEQADTAEKVTELNTTPVEAPASEDQKTPEPQDTATAEGPSVDEVRVDEAGTMVVAGRGDPGSTVDVLLDGEVVASTKVDTGGSFAALTSIPSSNAARSLTLRSGDGKDEVASAEEIILAPVGSSTASTSDRGVLSTETNGGTVADNAGDVIASRADAPPVGAPIAASENENSVEPAFKEEMSSKQEADSSERSQVASEGSDAPRDTETTQADEVATLDQKEGEAEQESGQQIAVLRSDAQGVELLKPPLAATDSVVLDTIGYDDDGVVQLGGRANTEAAQVRAYLNNRLAAELQVGPDGDWRGDLPNVEPGVYTLRIDAVTADGRVSSRVETPFKRETADVLAAATATAADTGTVRAVTVQAGDTLWAIARERYGEGLLYVQVFEANRTAIRDPDLIYPGQVFDLPDD